MDSRRNSAKYAARRSLFWPVLRLLWMLSVIICSFLVWAYAALWPDASGVVVYEKGGTTVDASHADQGYIMVKHNPTGKKVKLRVSLGKETLTYDLNEQGDFEVFPLQLGDGTYELQVFEQVSGSKYKNASSIKFAAALTDAILPYLYPNQYVWYTQDSATVALGQELCGALGSDGDKVGAVYEYMMRNFVYDYIRASNVQQGGLKGYLPSIDTVLSEKKGICFDISAVTACMLRTQNIPTQMVIGYADTTYHAWNNVLIDGTWYRYDITSDICNGMVQTYTAERVY